MRLIDDDMPLADVRYTANFAFNLDSIKSFWIATGVGKGYDRVLDALTDAVVPNLARHPDIGRPFAKRIVDSVEAERVVEYIASRLTAIAQDAHVREYVIDEYLVLYACFRDAHNRSSVVQLLSIKHQVQLTIDFQPGR